MVAVAEAAEAMTEAAVAVEHCMTPGMGLY